MGTFSKDDMAHEAGPALRAKPDAIDPADTTYVVIRDRPLPPAPRLDDPDSVFCGRTVAYCFEKILDFCYHPKAVGTSHFAEFGVESILVGLQDLEQKMRAAGMVIENSRFPTALHAIAELQHFVRQQSCAISSEIEARIYIQSLEDDLQDLRRLEWELDHPQDSVSRGYDR